MLNFWKQLLDKTLRVLSRGRIPKQGAVFQITPTKKDSRILFLRTHPRDRFTPLVKLELGLRYHETGSMLVLEVEELKPLWDLWVKVLFSSERDQKVGWVPYTEFCQVVFPDWVGVEEEEEEG